MKLAVITPYYKEPTAKLRRCHESVLRQGIPADHFMIADGYPDPEVDSWNVRHLKLPVGMNDSGDTPRVLGLSMASTLKYDGFLFLDGDNWFEDGHLEQMVAGQRETGSPVVTCPRILRRLDGSQLAVCTESDGDEFCDFNCYLFTREALQYLKILFLASDELAYFTDRVLWAHLRQNSRLIARVARPTVNYETTRIMHYQQAGEEPPPEARVTVFNKNENRCITMTAEEYAAMALNPNIQFSTVEKELIKRSNTG